MTITESMPDAPLKDAAQVAGELAAKAGPDGLDLRTAFLNADRRAYVPFLLFAVVLLILPIPLITQLIAAVTTLICGLGLMGGASGPWIPGFLAKVRLTKDGLDKTAAFFKGQGWLHLLVNPRFGEFSTGAGEKMAGFVLFLIGVSLLPPQMPHVIPLLAILVLALGLLQRDGLVMLIGVTTGVGWIAFLAAMGAGFVMHRPFALGWVPENAPMVAKMLTAHVPAATPPN